MTDLDPLILDLCEWISKKPRSYADVMDAWRTSCPRLTVWEDAIERNLVERVRSGDGEWIVIITPAGRTFLSANNRQLTEAV